MKKKLLLMFLIFIVVATVANVPKAKAATPVVKFSPEYLVISEPGLTSQLNITVTDVTDLLFWVINITWDPSIIEVTIGDSKGLRKGGTYYNIYEGPFMESFRDAHFFVEGGIDNTHGKITLLTGGYTGGGSTASGSGVLAIINFTSVNYGTTTIDINGPSYVHPGQSALITRTGADMPHDDWDGKVTVGEREIPPIWTELWFQATTVVVIIVIIVIAAVRTKVIKMPVRHSTEREKELGIPLEE